MAEALLAMTLAKMELWLGRRQVEGLSGGVCLPSPCCLPLAGKPLGNQPTDLEVTKAWSLMACTTSSNLILVVRVQPW